MANARVREIQPVGSWRTVPFILKENKLTVYLNGFSIQEHDLGSANWKQQLTTSKPDNALISKGHFTGRIGLQDWAARFGFELLKSVSFEAYVPVYYLLPRPLYPIS